MPGGKAKEIEKLPVPEYKSGWNFSPRGRISGPPDGRERMSAAIPDLFIYKSPSLMFLWARTFSAPQALPY
jgi:hypothetical protein